MEVKKLPVWWKPIEERYRLSSLNKFRKTVNAKYNLTLESYDDLHNFSTNHLIEFWATLWDFAGVRHHRLFDQVLKDAQAKPGDVPRFFEGARLNLAENMLFPLHPTHSIESTSPKDWPANESIAVYVYKEASSIDSGPRLKESVSWGELRRRVALLSSVFRQKGLKAGDRIASVSANTCQPIVIFFASLTIGAIFSALPTDAGEQAIYGRLSQIQPKLVFTDEFTLYNGKVINVVDRVLNVADQLLSNGKIEDPTTFEVLCIVDDAQKSNWKKKKFTAKCSTFSSYVESAGHKMQDSPPLLFESMPFNHPALIVFSSGTTGEPKSICHSAGGILINSKKETLLHYDLDSTDTFMQLTTCGWIMWLMQVNNLLAGASIITYDGSPLHPTPLATMQLISSHKGKVTGFGGSPRLLSEMERWCEVKRIANPSSILKLDSLKFATSTGSPLNIANVRFFYEKLASKHTQLISISGGTDLAGCLVGSAVNVPVQGHLIGAKCLGMDIRILDPISGEDVEEKGESGELVVAKPFPTQPLYFWGAAEDKGKLQEKYMDSYYRRFTQGSAVGFWAQGDFIVRDLKTGALEILGRSDGVLNPSGVRFGSAEIYSIVESGRFPCVLDSVVVGQRRPGITLGNEEKAAINKAIKEAYSARHVPKHIFQVGDIPVTANGKKTELAVKAVVSGNTAFKPSTATANPSALLEYAQYVDIEGVQARLSRQSRL